MARRGCSSSTRRPTKPRSRARDDHRSVRRLRRRGQRLRRRGSWPRGLRRLADRAAGAEGRRGARRRQRRAPPRLGPLVTDDVLRCRCHRRHRARPSGCRRPASSDRSTSSTCRSAAPAAAASAAASPSVASCATWPMCRRRSRGVRPVYVAAAGNDGGDVKHFPAAWRDKPTIQATAAVVDLVGPAGRGSRDPGHPTSLSPSGMLAVGSRSGGVRDSFSNCGTWVNAVAAGAGTVSRYPSPTGLGALERHELRHSAGERGARRRPGPHRRLRRQRHRRVLSHFLMSSEKENIDDLLTRAFTDPTNALEQRDDAAAGGGRCRARRTAAGHGQRLPRAAPRRRVRPPSRCARSLRQSSWAIASWRAVRRCRSPPACRTPVSSSARWSWRREPSPCSTVTTGSAAMSQRAGLLQRAGRHPEALRAFTAALRRRRRHAPIRRSSGTSG